MTVPDADLEPEQEKAIASLLHGKTREEAAEEAGVSDSTLYRWLRDEAFQRRYRSAQKDLFESAMSGLQSAAEIAVTTLKSVMTDANAKDSARVTAAKAVLEFARQQIQAADIEERLAALEERSK